VSFVANLPVFILEVLLNLIELVHEVLDAGNPVIVSQTALESGPSIGVMGFFFGHKLGEHLMDFEVGADLLRALSQVVPRSEIDSLTLFEQENDNIGVPVFTCKVKSRVSFVVCYINISFLFM